MASDFTKPYKIHTLYEEEVKEKMWPLDVGDLFGVGRKSVPKLNKLNIFTIKDLATTKPEILYPFFKNQSQAMINWANGIDDSLVISTPPEPKGIGNEITLETDVDDILKLNQHLLYLSEKVGARIRKQNKYANVIAVVLKDNTFKRYSHQKKLETATDDSTEIYNNAKKILKEIYNDEKIRLIGLRLDNLTDKKIKQVSIFDEDKEPENIDKVVDEINQKFGNIVKKASLINKKYRNNKIKD
jgi:DNA polymerase-4